MAAGNEGDLPITLTKTMTADDKELKTFITPIYSSFRYGQVYVYSEDETEFVIKVVVYNKSRGTVTMEIPISTNTEGQAIYYASPDAAQEGDNTHANFTKAFNGYVGVGTMLDEDCGRYYALIDFQTLDNSTTNADGNYILGFVVTGQEGKRIDCYCNGSYSVLDDYDQAGWLSGSTNSTVTDQACSNNVIAVGSYNIRNDWASLDGNLYGYPNSFPVGKISSFSSYGTLHDGRKLPHVCAPGCTVISSTNTYYVNNSDNGITDEALQGKYTGESTTNYWHQCFGTSMACPVVTGSIALWLEADPGLTVDDVKEIIAKTATVDDDVTGFTGDPVQWGAGKFNAYEGLKEVLRKQGSVGSLTAKNDRLLVKTIGENQYNAFVAGADCLDVVVYNISGQPVLRKSVAGDETSINVEGLQRGYYIMHVNGRYTHRILVK
ncbi:MAG: S8 family peptidase [Candidatus Limisoma sp.]